MEPKFNSLFDNEFDENNEADFYPINKQDDTYITSNILLTFDREKLSYNDIINQRNYGDSKDYRLGPRPCSTRHSSSNKFCDHPGLPEVYEEKTDKCTKYFMPNSSIGNRKQYIRNIDLEHKILQMDYKDSKCNNKQIKDDMCDPNDPNCALSCDTILFKNDKFDIQRNTGRNVLLEEHKNYCKNMNNSFNQIKNDFLTYRPTKRKNTINW